MLNIEGVTQGEPLSMVLYGITLFPLAEELRAANPGLLSLFYADNATFDGLARRSAQLLKLLMKRGPDRGYFPELDKSHFISDTPEQEAGAKREFAAEGLSLNLVSGSRYLVAYLGPQAELEAWVKPQVEAWAYGVQVLAKISRRHPQSAYYGLGMSQKLEWQYLQRTVPGVGTLMGTIEETLREKVFPSLFWGEEVTANFRKILGHSIKYGGLGIPDPQQSAECAYNTSKAASRELVDSLQGGSVLNYLGHR